MTEPLLEVRWGSATDPGRRRQNEDKALAATPVFLVADGMGGHCGGELAAAQVVLAFEPLVGRAWLELHVLRGAIIDAGERLRELGSGAGAPGSTLAGVGLTASSGVPCWLAFNIGDSRVYRMQSAALEQVTVDHSEAEARRRAGDVVGAREAAKNLITRALGAGQDHAPEADVWLFPAARGDRILICSDGLTGELTDQLIAATMLTRADPQVAADELVRAAIAAGGRDNITVVVVDAVRVRPEPPGPTGSGRHAADTLDRTVPGEEVRHA